MRRLAVVGATVGILLALPIPGAGAEDGLPPAPVGLSTPRLSEEGALGAFLRDPKVTGWLARYPPKPTTAANFDGSAHVWRIGVWSGKAGEIAKGVVDDSTGRVTQVMTGPQVAWGMARGTPWQFGGRILLRWPVWVAFSVAFLIGLGDLRRPLAFRNIDLLVMLSFGVSLVFFNHGDVFRSAAFAAPPLAYLTLRFAWIGVRGRPLTTGLQVPVGVLAVMSVFLVGFRIGINVAGPTPVIDVGYAGVIGADRIVHGQAPYGHMPQEGALRACGPAGADGRIRDRIQANGHCESSNPNGDTYGPLTYEAYVPFLAAFGWSGRWDRLWAAHAATIAFDLLTLAGLVAAGLRFGGHALAARLAFGWVAFPFTGYALAANTNDALMPALLVWGFVAAASATGRGAAVAAAGLTKFGALVLVPLWLGYSGLGRRPLLRFSTAFGAVSAIALSVLLLEPSLVVATRTLWNRTIGYQIGRASPFSPWGWGQYHARGIPDLHLVQLALWAVLLAGVGASVFLPVRKGPLELAALSAALLACFELALTHWFYLYLLWIVPFALLALLLPARGSAFPREVRA